MKPVYKMKQITYMYKKPTCLLTLSGGIDSTVLLYYLLTGCKEYPLCVYIDYGTKCREGELRAAKAITKRVGVPLVILPFTLYKDISESYILGNTKKYKKGSQFWLDGRNGMIGLIMAILAVKYNVNRVYMGANADDYDGIYLDTNKEFYTALNSLVKNSIRHDVKIIAPFLDLGWKKADVIKMGNCFGIDWVKYTHSCSSSPVTCCDYVKCESCYWRQKDFEEAGLEDPFRRKKCTTLKKR